MEADAAAIAYPEVAALGADAAVRADAAAILKLLSWTTDIAVRGKVGEEIGLPEKRALGKGEPPVDLPSGRLNQTLTSRDLHTVSLKRDLVVP